MVTRVCLDTNILIDYLAQARPARDVFKRYDELVISKMAYMEVMVGIDPNDLFAQQEAEDMMTMFEIMGMDRIASRHWRSG